MLTFAGTAAVQGLIAIWAATARVNWFIRALAVWGGVILLVPIRLYEPAAVFVFASPLIVAAVAIANGAGKRYQAISVGFDRLLTPSNLPLGLADLWAPAAVMTLPIIGFEVMLQGHWWFAPADFLVQCMLTFTIVTIAYDCVAARGRRTSQRLISLVRLATTSLRLTTASLDPPHTDPQTTAKFRFELRDLFCLILLAALITAGVQTIHHRYTWQEWGAFAIWGTLIGTIVSLAYGCVVSRWRLLLAPLLAVAIVVTARVAPNICGPFIAERLVECLSLGRAFAWKGAEKQLALEIVNSEVALLVAAVLVLICLGQCGNATTPLRKLARGGLTVLTLTACIGLGWLYWQMLWLTPVPPAFARGTTHYDEIAAITRHADPRWFWGSPIPPAPGNTLRKLPVTGDLQLLLAELSVLVSDENYVPFQVPIKVFRKEDVDDFRRGYEHFYSFAQVIDNEAIRASTQGDYERAAELALVNVRLGTMLRRGGIDSHAECGKYCENYGYQRLTLIRGNLSPETTWSVLAAIGRAATLPEDRAIVRARSQAFEERAIGWTERLRNVFDQLRRGGYYWDDPNTEVNTFNILLQTDLAIRLFQHDRGELPKTLEGLAPGYLATVPLDPLAKSPQPLRYRVENGQFVLYSVNSFGQDNGGVFGDRTHGIHHSTHDIDVETWIRP